MKVKKQQVVGSWDSRGQFKNGVGAPVKTGSGRAGEMPQEMNPAGQSEPGSMSHCPIEHLNHSSGRKQLWALHKPRSTKGSDV